MSTPKKAKVVKSLTDQEVGNATYDMMRRHVSQLSEHVSSIQVCATVLNPNGSTSFINMGSGDMFARIAVTDLWLSAQQSVMEI